MVATLLIILAVLFVWRMDRLERQLEDVHDSLIRILTLPVDLREAAEDVPRREKNSRRKGSTCSNLFSCLPPRACHPHSNRSSLLWPAAIVLIMRWAESARKLPGKMNNGRLD